MKYIPIYIKLNLIQREKSFIFKEDKDGLIEDSHHESSPIG